MGNAPATNRYWRFEQHPDGSALSDAFSFQSEDCPQPGDGEVLFRVAHISMDAGTRMWISPREDGYQPPLPKGTKMTGLAIGQIVESRHPDFTEGQWVRAFGQWADYSLVKPEESGLVAIDGAIKDVRQHLGILGMNGWTALAGIEEVGGAKEGDTVLVSAAAGCTGILASQIAKILGCKVIGFAGGPEKCRFLTDEMGLDMAIDYKAGHVSEQLAEVPGGIDIYFDNVAGPLLDDVLPNMALYGRIALCGLLAGYEGDQPLPGPNRFDQILMRRLRIEGFFSPDFAAERGADYSRRLRDWYDEGKLSLPLDITEGLENCVEAYGRLFSGANIGKVLVDV